MRLAEWGRGSGDGRGGLREGVCERGAGRVGMGEWGWESRAGRGGLGEWGWESGGAGILWLGERG